MQKTVNAGVRAGRFLRRARTIVTVSAVTLRGYFRTRRFIQTRPFLAELIAVGTGYVLGRALRSRHRR